MGNVSGEGFHNIQQQHIEAEAKVPEKTPEVSPKVHTATPNKVESETNAISKPELTNVGKIAVQTEQGDVQFSHEATTIDIPTHSMTEEGHVDAKAVPKDVNDALNQLMQSGEKPVEYTKEEKSMLDTIIKDMTNEGTKEDYIAPELGEKIKTEVTFEKVDIQPSVKKQDINDVLNQLMNSGEKPVEYTKYEESMLDTIVKDMVHEGKKELEDAHMTPELGEKIRTEVTFEKVDIQQGKKDLQDAHMAPELVEKIKTEVRFEKVDIQPSVKKQATEQTSTSKETPKISVETDKTEKTEQKTEKRLERASRRISMFVSGSKTKEADGVAGQKKVESGIRKSSFGFASRLSTKLGIGPKSSPVQITKEAAKNFAESQEKQLMSDLSNSEGQLQKVQSNLTIARGKLENATESEKAKVEAEIASLETDENTLSATIRTSKESLAATTDFKEYLSSDNGHKSMMKYLNKNKDTIDEFKSKTEIQVSQYKSHKDTISKVSNTLMKNSGLTGIAEQLSEYNTKSDAKMSVVDQSMENFDMSFYLQVFTRAKKEASLWAPVSKEKELETFDSAMERPLVLDQDQLLANKILSPMKSIDDDAPDIIDGFLSQYMKENKLEKSTQSENNKEILGEELQSQLNRVLDSRSTRAINMFKNDQINTNGFLSEVMTFMVASDLSKELATESVKIQHDNSTITRSRESQEDIALSAENAEVKAAQDKANRIAFAAAEELRKTQESRVKDTETLIGMLENSSKATSLQSEIAILKNLHASQKEFVDGLNKAIGSDKIDSAALAELYTSSNYNNILVQSLIKWEPRRADVMKAIGGEFEDRNTFEGLLASPFQNATSRMSMPVKAISEQLKDDNNIQIAAAASGKATLCINKWMI